MMRDRLRRACDLKVTTGGALCRLYANKHNFRRKRVGKIIMEKYK